MARKDALLSLHERLIAQRDDLRKKLGHDVHIGRTDGAGTSDLGDLANEDTEQEINSQLAAFESRELVRIQRAIEAIREGRYGNCEGCGKSIPITRLRSVAAGRTFGARDGAEGTPKVLLVTQTAAERFWPEESAVGKRVKFGATDDPDSEFVTVIGVVDDVMQTGIGDPLFPGVYVPAQQSPSESMSLVVRASGGVDAVVGTVRDALRQIDANLPIYDVDTMQARIAQDDWEQKLFTRIFSAFALIALILASVGLYGLVSYSVAQRTREIGVRMALGADRASVVNMVVRQGLKLTAGGLAIGLVGALGVTQVIEGLLFGVSPTDPLTFGGIFLVLAAVAAIASYLPARRATRVDPVTALR